MQKLYKQISTCSMCKTRFVVENDRRAYAARLYCSDCYSKYFPKQDGKDSNKF